MLDEKLDKLHEACQAAGVKMFRELNKHAQTFFKAEARYAALRRKRYGLERYDKPSVYRLASEAGLSAQPQGPGTSFSFRVPGEGKPFMQASFLMPHHRLSAVQYGQSIEEE